MVDKTYGRIYTNNYDGEYAYYYGEINDVEKISHIAAKNHKIKYPSSLFGICTYCYTTKQDMEEKIMKDKMFWIKENIKEGEEKVNMRFIDVTNNIIEVIS